MEKQTFALIGAIIAALISLSVAIINLRSTKNLERNKREFELTKRDLDKLEELMFTMSEIIVPSLPTEEEIKKLSKEQLQDIMQNKFNQIQPEFKKSVTSMLRCKSLFPENIQEMIFEKYNQAEDAKGVDAFLNRRDFIGWAPNVIDSQINSIRKSWAK